MYINETCSTLADFINKLQTFLNTAGWTIDEHTPGDGVLAVSRNNVRVVFQWDTATPANLGIYQYEGAAYNSGNDPWAQNNDSGNGRNSTTNSDLDDSRYVALSNSMVQYWCFENDTYAHVVVQKNNTPDFYHFGFGTLEKEGSWTGGEYAYGQRWSLTGTTQQQVLTNSFGLDGTFVDSNGEQYAATLHIEGMTDQGGSGKWAVVMGAPQSSAELGNDRQGTPQARIHVIGCMRGNAFGYPLMHRFDGSTSSGFIPLTQAPVLYYNRTSNELQPLGFMPDVRFGSNRYFANGEEVTVGSDTWVVFPLIRKASTGAAANDGSGFAAVFYKKVTT